jgi:hypothetical protein
VKLAVKPPGYHPIESMVLARRVHLQHHFRDRSSPAINKLDTKSNTSNVIGFRAD